MSARALFDVGCPGRTVQQILDEQRLRAAIEGFVTNQPSPSLGRKDVVSFVGNSPDLKFALQPYVRPWLVRFGGIIYVILVAILTAIVALGYYHVIPWIYFIGAALVLVASVLLLRIKRAGTSRFRTISSVRKSIRLSTRRILGPTTTWSASPRSNRARFAPCSYVRCFS